MKDNNKYEISFFVSKGASYRKPETIIREAKPATDDKEPDHVYGRGGYSGHVVCDTLLHHQSLSGFVCLQHSCV